MEKTLVLIKPDAVEKKFVGEIIAFYERNGLQIQEMKWMYASEPLLRRHYEEHVSRDFYPELQAFMLSGPIVAICFKGEEAIEAVRDMNGSTNPAKARYGTIRHMFGESVQRNAVHGSADKEQAAREVELWFGETH